MLRRVIFWTHLCVGLAAGVVIFVLCLTGAILAFELQIVNWAEHDARARPPGVKAILLSPTEIAAKVTPAAGERIVSLEWSADQDMPVRVLTDKRAITLLNGYTGEVLGSGAPELRDFMRWVTNLHTNLVLQLSGHWMVSFANVGFVFLIVSGLWLWWPRQWRWNQWRWQAFKLAMTPRFRLTGKARDWNWHTTLGFWFLLPLLIIATSGLVLSFKVVDTWWREFAGTHLVMRRGPDCDDRCRSRVATNRRHLVAVVGPDHGAQSRLVFTRPIRQRHAQQGWPAELCD